MQADVQKRRPVCFLRHFSKCFSRIQTLGFIGGRHHSSRESVDPPTVAPDPVDKLSAVSKSFGKRGYTNVTIQTGVGRRKLKYDLWPAPFGKREPRTERHLNRHCREEGDQVLNRHFPER